MKRSKFSEEQIAYTSRQAEGSEVVAYVCLQPGISETTGTHLGCVLSALSTLPRAVS